MDDRKLNPLRLLIALGIGAYFIFLVLRPGQPGAPTTTQTQSAHPMPTACAAQIEQVGLTSYELRLRIKGSAERIIIYTDQGNLTVNTTEAGSAGEYRIRTPAPATAVQLDDCPALNLR
ncbi:hypothetical protein [Meiothermus rufus]|uniref:hypothetical protein n=1 Tax=Meiothermus rufus TaxID=604332 RepID=UPI0004037404|nr:hypothetical protein [Meiothermus rufus]